MRFGPTSLQVSSVAAKGLRRPRLREDLRISEQTVAGETSYVIKNYETNSYNRYGSTEYELLKLCDGAHTAAEISDELTTRHPDSPLSEAEVLDFLDSIEPAMWERSVGEKNLAVLERIRDERKGRLDQSSMLYISFKAWDPDKTLAKIDPYLSWMFTSGFVVFSVFIFVIACYLLAGDWARVQQDTSALYNFSDKSAYDIWMFWILLMILGGIHEFGHGLTCKHFGGDVHQMGFLLIYFTPAFYTDTTDILLFRRGSQRQWVIFAGIWIELVLCGLSGVVWHFSPAGSVLNDLAYKMMLLSGIQGALLNLNPLIKADGYYALSQFLQVDNLREDSFAFLRAWAQKYLLRHDIDLPAASKRQRRIFFLFGVTAIIYSTSLLIIVLVFAKNVLVSKLGDWWGALATLAVVYFFTRKGIRQVWPPTLAWLRQKREDYMAWKMTRAQQAGALGVALLLLLPPVGSSVSTPLVLEPGRTAHVHAEVGGQIANVYIQQGQAVKAGQVLATLRNPEIEADAVILRQQLALASSDLRNGQDRSDYEKAAGAVRDRKRLQEEFAVAENRVAALQIRAPIDGVISTAGVSQQAGAFLDAGDELTTVVDRSTMKARILVRDWDLEDVHPGAAAKAKVIPFPYRTYSGKVDQILPAAAADRPVSETQDLQRLGQQLTNYLAVDMEFANPDGSLREGMTGTAKIAGKRSSIAHQVARATWRWTHAQFW
ncbi:MAG: HlyD family efflux transporter periplasmic adaptor subunit [Candidatus Acidiferrales bacterium]